ncbi:hypothetical protein GCM10023322_33000 [Rugosimonospora acidiphila]|uniref:HTH araC/xylS-type domain-containing protein n=1 Tax=Rugosimonospora acidiphila TaxID=556531 RepID=A0ABP9RSY6_9ACTN
MLVDAHHQVCDLAVRPQPWTDALPAPRWSFGTDEPRTRPRAAGVDATVDVRTVMVYLGRLFTQHVGLAPMNFLARTRAERAALLLTHSTLPAAQVGAAVGWADPTYFARRFRALVGLTPSEYRQRSRVVPSEE